MLGGEEAEIEGESVVSLRWQGQVEAEAEEEVQLEQVEFRDANAADPGPAAIETISIGRKGKTRKMEIQDHQCEFSQVESSRNFVAVITATRSRRRNVLELSVVEGNRCCSFSK